MINYRVVKEVFPPTSLEWSFSRSSSESRKAMMMIVEAITMTSDSQICCVIIKLKLIN